MRGLDASANASWPDMRVLPLPSQAEMKGISGSDVSVQGTNDDAQVSKLSCVNLGYFKDDFIGHFVRKTSRRSPLINRGYYSRNAALRMLLHRFLDLGGGQPKQVLSLGAGFDTTWFQLESEGRSPSRYIELDFADVTRRKAAIIAGTPRLAAMVEGRAERGGEQEEQGCCLKQEDVANGRVLGGRYSLVPADLRDLPGVEAALDSAGFDASLPTYVLSECCLVYMEPVHSTALVRWLGQRCASAAFVVYEQIRPGDPFGRQMMLNLESRGCPLKGISGTPTLEAHMARFTSNGWQRADSRDMDTVYRRHLDPQDKRRAERLEIFDEFEEWHMIQQHYSITIAINDRQADGLFDSFDFTEFQTKLPPFLQQQQQPPKHVPDAG